MFVPVRLVAYVAPRTWWLPFASDECADCRAKDVFLEAHMGDDRGVIVPFEPNDRRRASFGDAEPMHQFRAINVEQRIFKFAPRDESRQGAFVHMRDGRIF